MRRGGGPRIADRFDPAPGLVVDHLGQEAFLVECADQEPVVVIKIAGNPVVGGIGTRKNLRRWQRRAITAHPVSTVNRYRRDHIVVPGCPSEPACPVIVEFHSNARSTDVSAVHYHTGRIDRLDHPPGLVVDRPVPAVGGVDKRAHGLRFGVGGDRAQRGQVRRRNRIGIDHRCNNAIGTVVLVLGHRAVVVDRCGQAVLLVVSVIGLHA